MAEEELVNEMSYENGQQLNFKKKLLFAYVPYQMSERYGRRKLKGRVNERS